MSVSQPIQFPSRSYLYLITDGENIKIGVSNNPTKRLASLQIGSSRRLKIIHEVMFNKCPYPLEKALHRVFKPKWVSGEWFHLNQASLVNVIDGLAETLFDMHPVKYRSDYEALYTADGLSNPKSYIDSGGYCFDITEILSASQ